MKIIKAIAAQVLVLALPLMAAAQVERVNPVEVKGDPLDQILGIIKTLTTWLLTALITVAVIFVIIAAYKYLTAAGDPEKVKKAGNMIIYAAVAIGIGLLAKVITTLAEQLVRK